MYCCAECFGDRGLRKDLIPSRSNTVGTCTYCGTADVTVVRPIELLDLFELLVSAYRADPSGKPLVHWFREDWGLFGHPRMDDPHAKELLAEILDDGEIVRQLFVPEKDIPADRLIEWQELRDELMYRNRFFPQVRIDYDRLGNLVDMLRLGAGEVPTTWYRARIQSAELPFGLGEMGAPHKRIASNGRANPAGIPYLYLGSTPKTALSEIRPHTGETACVADFTIPPDLSLIDLRAPRKTVSPFVLESGDDICKLRSDLPFLERLGDELTRPVLPQSAAIDYTPSQYLCEFIKGRGYHGVVYRSSVEMEGINLALFDPSLAKAGNVEQYRVAKVAVEIESIGVSRPARTRRGIRLPRT